MRGLPLSAVQKRLDRQHMHIKVYGQFRDKRTGKLRVCAICKKCGYKWTPLKDNETRKNRPRGCPRCAHRIPWTASRIRIRVNKLSHHNIKLKFIYPWSDENGYVLAICLKCGYKWKALIGDLIKGTGCPRCHHHVPWTAHSASRRVNQIFHGAYIVKMPNGLPQGKNTRVIAYCPRHNYTWYPRLETLLQGYGCQHCAGEKLRWERNGKGRKHFLYWYNNQNDITIPRLKKVMKHYVNQHQHTICICNHCSHRWRTTFENLMNDEGCPACNKAKSHGEDYVRLYLLRHGLHEQFDKRKLPKNFYFVHGYHLHTSKSGWYRLHADFLINVSHHLIAVEFDGVQHFKPVAFDGHMTKRTVTRFHELQKHDRRKNRYCKKHHIKMIRIQNKKGIANDKFIKKLVKLILDTKLQVPHQLHKVSHQMSLF